MPEGNDFVHVYSRVFHMSIDTGYSRPTHPVPERAHFMLEGYSQDWSEMVQPRPKETILGLRSPPD